MGLWVRVTSNDYARGHKVRAEVSCARSVAGFARHIALQRCRAGGLREPQPVCGRTAGAKRFLADDAANRDERGARLRGL